MRESYYIKRKEIFSLNHTLVSFDLIKAHHCSRYPTPSTTPHHSHLLTSNPLTDPSPIRCHSHHHHLTGPGILRRFHILPVDHRHSLLHLRPAGLHHRHLLEVLRAHHHQRNIDCTLQLQLRTRLPYSGQASRSPVRLPAAAVER